MSTPLDQYLVIAAHLHRGPGAEAPELHLQGACDWAESLARTLFEKLPDGARWVCRLTCPYQAERRRILDYVLGYRPFRNGLDIGAQGTDHGEQLKQRQSRHRLAIFFLGHGFEDRGERWFVPSDAPATRHGKAPPESYLIKESQLLADLARVNATSSQGLEELLLVTDCCRVSPGYDDDCTGSYKAASGQTDSFTVHRVFSCGMNEKAYMGMSNSSRETDRKNFTDFIAEKLKEARSVDVLWTQEWWKQQTQAFKQEDSEQNPSVQWQAK